MNRFYSRDGRTYKPNIIHCYPDIYVVISKTGHPIGHLRVNFGLSHCKFSKLNTIQFDMNVDPILFIRFCPIYKIEN